MKIDEYQELARTTAIYPSPIIYPAFGLCGECGELIEKIHHNSDAKEVLKEGGDCLWYIANLTYDCGLKMSKGINSHIFLSVDSYSGKTSLMVNLAVYSGQVAELVKKMLRDDNGVMTVERRELLILCLIDLYDSLTDIVHNVTGEATLEKAAQMNVEKLKSRQERGKLKGEGDSR